MLPANVHKSTIFEEDMLITFVFQLYSAREQPSYFPSFYNPLSPHAMHQQQD